MRHKQKTIEAFSRLPEEFTVEDVMRCCDVPQSTAKTKIFLLAKDRLIEKTGEFVENGTVKAVYKKTGTIL